MLDKVTRPLGFFALGAVVVNALADLTGQGLPFWLSMAAWVLFMASMVLLIIQAASRASSNKKPEHSRK